MGGDIFLHNLKLAGTTPATFNFHKHNDSVANSFAGAFYYLEESSTLTSRIQFLQDISATPEDYSIMDSLKVLTKSGGFFYSNVKKEL